MMDLKSEGWSRLLGAMATATAVMLVGCTAPVGSSIEVAPDSAAVCAGQCQQIGMRLSAVAIMANNVGCVCQQAVTAGSDAKASVADQGGTAGAGMATLLMQQQAREQAQRQQQAQHVNQH